MRPWLARARRMTIVDYVTAVEVLGLVVWIEIALKVMPFSRLLQRISRPHSPSPAVPDVQRLGRFVMVAYDVLPLPTTCLRRSLVLHALLTRRGAPSRFCVGVARNGASLEAHSWVECGGVATEASLAPFSELQTPSQFTRTSEPSHV